MTIKKVGNWIFPPFICSRLSSLFALEIRHPPKKRTSCIWRSGVTLSMAYPLLLFRCVNDAIYTQMAMERNSTASVIRCRFRLPEY
jgi:hypothetical protein